MEFIDLAEQQRQQLRNMRSTYHSELIQKLRSRNALIGIVGLGYVGLPLSLTSAAGG